MNSKKSNHQRIIGIGLIGLGTVGTGVAKTLQAKAGALAQKTGIRLELRKVCVRSLSKKRSVRIPRALLTRDANDILSDPGIDIVVELIGGIHPAKEILLKAFAAGKHVVTANKALLAEEGKSIFEAAARARRRIGMEASVCGGIPVIQSIREGLVSNEVDQLLGIVNGTCNYILTGMSQRQMSFDAALKEAQAKGFAEKDPGLDVDGIDSAHKLAVLARLAFGADVPFKSISVEGIRKLTPEDISYAYDLGYVIKLLAIGKRSPRQPSADASVADADGIELRVHPTMLPFGHALSNVWGVYNAVLVHGDLAGDLLFSGKGAGMFPTASAVVSDILDIARNVGATRGLSATLPTVSRPAVVRPLGELVSKFYLRFQVVDKPGVLGRIAQTLGAHHISILSVNQKESHDPRSTPVIILTYEARERDVRKALAEIDSRREISHKTTVLRVEK